MQHPCPSSLKSESHHYLQKATTFSLGDGRIFSVCTEQGLVIGPFCTGWTSVAICPASPPSWATYRALNLLTSGLEILN